MIVTLTPWTVSEADLRFRKYAMVSVLSGLVVASVVSIVPLPEEADLPKERTTRLAEIILPPQSRLSRRWSRYRRWSRPKL